MKTQKTESVVKSWVSELPFTQQAVLLSVVRGPDGINKFHPAKDMVRVYRDVILNAAYPSYASTPDCEFMTSQYGDFPKFADAFFDNVDSLPHHFIMHFFHAAEIVGYKHPDSIVRAHWLGFYHYAAGNLHLRRETESEMDERLKH